MGLQRRRQPVLDRRVHGTLQVYGKCMDITGANYNNGTNIELWTCNGDSNQQWHLP